MTAFDPDWPGNWPEVPEEIGEIVVRAYYGTEADYDRAYEELVKLGFTGDAANYVIMSSCW